MTVLVTGAAGFLGSHVTDLLIEAGDHPRVLVRPATSMSQRRPMSRSTAEIRRSRRPGGCTERRGSRPSLCSADRAMGPRSRVRTDERPRARDACARCDERRGPASRARQLDHRPRVAGTARPMRPRRCERSRIPTVARRPRANGILERLIRNEQAPVTIVRPGWIYGPRDTGEFRALGTVGRRGADAHGRRRAKPRAADLCPRCPMGVLLAGEAEGAEGRRYLLVNDEAVTQRDFIGAMAAELGVPAPGGVSLPARAGARRRQRRPVGRLLRQNGPRPSLALASNSWVARTASRSRGHDRSSASHRWSTWPTVSGAASTGSAKRRERPRLRRSTRAAEAR